MSSDGILRTTVVGSYPQPDWLVDRDMLGARLPPRTRAPEIWRIPVEHLEEAQDDATLVAVRDLERAGIDIITDGEIRRESYSNRFAAALEGMDVDNPGVAVDRTGHPNPVPAGNRAHPPQPPGPSPRRPLPAGEHGPAHQGRPSPGRSPCRSRRRTITTATRLR